MTRPVILALLTTVAACAALVVALPESRARTDVLLIAPDDAEARLARAARESRRAEQRVARLTREAEAATEAAEHVAAETAALAARIQQTEADIEVARAQLTITRAERAELTARLAEQQEPTARLAAALQTASRRPLALSALQPGSLKEVVYVRAVLDSAVPQIRARTANLRAELDKGRMLEAEAAAALESLRDGEQALRQRRAQLAALENRQRVASRTARGAAVREAERALALAEEARDLDGLVARLDDIAALRRELAALPGPVLRPADLAAALPTASQPVAAATSSAKPPRDFQLPVDGRTLVGFGAKRDSGLASTGLVLAPVAGAQVVAPARGRVAFAGPYRGFGRIVIIEHDGGWTSLVTGLARVDAAVGDTVIGGSPIGVAGGREEPVTIELRRHGEPANPLQFLR
ncbi:murein hydrolase activator EnvC family protein [Erythrobacter sanguineus]|uniref:Septal ring factor EnvC, activator of murein hydrolases AmiA and AmiB n=1 Tax=Erythrobacter sanguineus TaxID=198312 RepID=A0A1M7SUV7_9SPHN|nr:peptidoglycan DD-metalloendopeptidase family protein [Erythrobacter sanguineus]SHN62275.1 Septal ring factor EnvC, activator of murein hydrolases AmiA and AmiB [Erythrobacter sanguineus]